MTARKSSSSAIPVFHAGIRPVDNKGCGRLLAYDVRGALRDVLVHPGDLILADLCGVTLSTVVVPMPQGSTTTPDCNTAAVGVTQKEK